MKGQARAICALLFKLYAAWPPVLLEVDKAPHSESEYQSSAHELARADMESSKLPLDATREIQFVRDVCSRVTVLSDAVRYKPCVEKGCRAMIRNTCIAPSPWHSYTCATCVPSKFLK